MRVVIDTSVVVAALRSRRGASNALLVAALERRVEWLCSVPLFFEYEDALTRPDFLIASGWRAVEMRRFLDDAVVVMTPVALDMLWRPQLRDPADEMVLETAINGRADALATHNLRDFSPAVRFGIEVAPPARLLRRLAP
jgi:putative PIN family toxin of toxin-antitoxin system